MKIQAINTNYGINANQQNTQFKGVWHRVGENYLDRTLYHTEAFHPFTDGIQTLAKKFHKGSHLELLESTNMTKEEGKSAYEFLFEKIQNTKGYEAAKKLQQFMNTKLSGNRHNIMFLEKEDLADPTKTRSRLEISDVNTKISDYEISHNIAKKVTPEEKPGTDSTMTMEEFAKMISENGIA